MSFGNMTEVKETNEMSEFNPLLFELGTDFNHWLDNVEDEYTVYESLKQELINNEYNTISL